MTRILRALQKHIHDPALDLLAIVTIPAVLAAIVLALEHSG